MRRPLSLVLALITLYTAAAAALQDPLKLAASAAQALGVEEGWLLQPGADAQFTLQGESLELRRGLFSLHPEGEEPLLPVVVHPPEVNRGDALSGCALSLESLSGLEIRLTGAEERQLGSARGFPLDREGRMWSFVLGVPSTLEGGSYNLRFSGTGTGGERRFVYLGEINILPKAFSTQQIQFDTALSQLMTQPDPKKDEEFRQLQEVLKGFQQEAVWHSGSHALPVEGARVSSGYADRRQYRYADGGSSLSLHNGLDLAAPQGTPVRASGSGVVVLAAERLLTGKTVIIEHLPGVYSLYFHMSEITVSEQQRVLQGESIGAVGMTGLATGPHLHWELRAGGQPVNPLAAVERPLIDKTYYSSIMDGLILNERR